MSSHLERRLQAGCLHEKWDTGFAEDNWSNLGLSGTCCGPDAGALASEQIKLKTFNSNLNLNG